MQILKASIFIIAIIVGIFKKYCNIISKIVDQDSKGGRSYANMQVGVFTLPVVFENLYIYSCRLQRVHFFTKNFFFFLCLLFLPLFCHCLDYF